METRQMKGSIQHNNNNNNNNKGDLFKHDILLILQIFKHHKTMMIH